MSINKKSKGLFILHEGISSTIFNSQVIEHILQLNNSDYEFDILSFNTEYKIWGSSLKNRENLISLYPNLNIHLIKSINIFYPFAFIIHIFQLIAFFKKSKVDYSFIHSRSDYTQFIVLLSKFYHKLNSIWDCRGDSISEIKHALSNKNFIYKFYATLYIIPFFKFLLLKNLKKSNHIIFVSEFLKDILFKIKKPSYNFDVIPCLVNEKLFFYNNFLRTKMRNKYNIRSNQKVFIYSGSMVSYQSFGDQIEFYKNILSNDSNILFVLTSHIEIAKSFFNQFNNKNIFIKTVNFNKMNDYYNLADFAILLRDNNLLNQVASPTKFGEYCLSGLHVIMNKNVKQCYRNALRINNFIDVNNPILKNFDHEKRASISESSKLYYKRANYLKFYKQMYLNLVNPK